MLYYKMLCKKNIVKSVYKIVSQRTEERKVAIAVRAHPTIELLEDRLYVVTCGRAGFQVKIYPNNFNLQSQILLLLKQAIF